MQLNDSYVMQRLEQQLLEQMSSYDTAEANRISEPSQAAAVAMSAVLEAGGRSSIVDVVSSSGSGAVSAGESKKASVGQQHIPSCSHTSGTARSTCS